MAELMSLAEAKTYLDIPNVSQDTFVQQLIDSVESAFDMATNRKLLEATYIHQFDGNGEHTLISREFPVTAITEVNIDATWVFGAGTIVSTSDYFIDNELLLINKNTWPQGIRNIEISYTAGYSTALVPKDLQQAGFIYIDYLYRINNDRRVGVQTRSKLGENLTYFDGIPKNVLELLEPYKREVMVASRRKGGG